MGGAINNYKGELCVNDSTFTQNIASSGGAITDYEGDLIIDGSAFEGNVADNDGGAIYLKDSIKYESNNCTFKDNRPDDV